MLIKVQINFNFVYRTFTNDRGLTVHFQKIEAVKNMPKLTIGIQSVDVLIDAILYFLLASIEP